MLKERVELFTITVETPSRFAFNYCIIYQNIYVLIKFVWGSLIALIV